MWTKDYSETSMNFPIWRHSSGAAIKGRLENSLQMLHISSAIWELQ
jgi:hypothetical protein